MRQLIIVVLMGVLLIGTAWADPADDLLQDGNARFTAKDYRGALDVYERALRLKPDAYPLLFKAGVAAQMMGDTAKAVQYLERAHKAAPSNWQGTEHLVQAYEASGQTVQAQAMVDELVKIWKSGTDPAFSKTSLFRRDTIRATGMNFLVLQMFAPDPNKAEPLYDFTQMSASDKPIREYSVYMDKTATAAATAQAGKPVEAWAFVMLEPPNHRVVYLIINRRPSYVEAVQVMQKIWSGAMKPIMDAHPPIRKP